MATMKDVAKKAGVGLGTVSRVINNHPSVKDATRVKVQKAIKELDYSPNIIARNLKVSQSETIALIIPTIWHPFFSEFAYYVEENVSKRGFKLVLCNSDKNYQKEVEYLEMLKQNKVAGIIAITYNDIDNYVSSNLPIVSVDRHFSEDVVYVTSDNYNGGKMAVNKLIENGCKKLAFIGTTSTRPTDVKNRKIGFKDECIRQIIEYTIFDEKEPVENLEKKIENYIDENRDIDGIFAINDFVGLTIIKILGRKGIKIPEDIKIIGYDGVKMSTEQEFLISTIRQPVERMAKRAVDSIFDILENNIENKRRVLPVTYVKGSTTII